MLTSLQPRSCGCWRTSTAPGEGGSGEWPLEQWKLARVESDQRKNPSIDATNASRTMLFNIHEGKWDAELLSAMRIPESLLLSVIVERGVLQGIHHTRPGGHTGIWSSRRSAGRSIRTSLL